MFKILNIFNKKTELIEIRKGDITKLKNIDCIVNAANKTLLGGAGVDNAIHKAAGPRLYQECERLNGCKTGEAKITKAYNIPVKNIIHTVGPIYRAPFLAEKDGYKQEEMLADCYKKSLELAKENNLKSIAFPAISCGEYNYPLEQAAPIAINTVLKFLENNKDIKVIFILYNEFSYQLYKQIYKSIKEKPV